MEIKFMIKTLYSKDVIAVRVDELAKEISAHYGDSRPLIVALLNGAVLFAADLVRSLDIEIMFDTLGVSSYENDCQTGKIDFRTRLKINPAGRDVLVIDDILDTGFTLSKVADYFIASGASSVKTCVLLDKNLEGVKKPVKADWTGFECDNLYVVGYGLDSNELYRNLPYIGVIDTSI